MSTPACIANAVADALGVKDIALPLTPRRLHGLIAGAEPPRPAGAGIARIELPAEASREGRTLRGDGSFEVAAAPAAVWRALLDPDSLKAVIPGCHDLRKTGENDYVAEVSLGVGPVRGRFTATVGLSDLVTETSGRIGGALAGPLGNASGSGLLRLSPSPRGNADRLRLRSRRWRQGGGRRRPPARRRDPGDHRPVLRAARTPPRHAGRGWRANRPCGAACSAGRRRDEAAPLRLCAPGQRGGGARAACRAWRCGEGAGRRAVADGDAQPAPAGARPAHRHRAAR